MRLRERFQVTLAHQLGNPSGVPGRAVAAMLNRGNRATVTAAVDAARVSPGEHAADLGFGGGVGVPLLLDRVGPGGRVYAIDQSTTMVTRAARRFRREIAGGRLTVREGTLAALPLADESLDAAVTVNTVYFVPELSPFFAELARVLRREGRVVIGIGDPDGMAELPFTRHGFTIRPVPGLVAELERAGLTVADHRRVGSGERAFHLLVARR
ncbi:MAG: class I SAM-dependent methyltransferase [Micromonosporaceae bacterium]